jgi:hypothetical protein
MSRGGRRAVAETSRRSSHREAGGPGGGATERWRRLPGEGRRGAAGRAVPAVPAASGPRR